MRKEAHLTQDAKKKGRFTARSNGLMDREKTERLAWSSHLDYFRLIRLGRIGRTRACRQNDCCSESVSLGRATIQVRLAIHTFRISPEAIARCSFIGFPAPSREWCTTVSLSLYFEYRYFRRSTFDDFVHRRRSLPWMLSRTETYGRISFFISFGNDATLNVARKLRLIACKYT